MEVSKLKAFVEGTSRKLFEAEDRRLDRAVTELDRQNRELKGYVAEGFMFQGMLFIPNSARYAKAKGTARQSLSFTLQDQGNALLTDMNAIAFDKKMIEQFLYKMLYNCVEWQDIRDTVPECLVQFWPALAQMEKRYAKGFFAPKDERFQREANKVIPKIEFYSVIHLMY